LITALPAASSLNMPLFPADLAALTELEVLRIMQVRESEQDWTALLFQPLSEDGLMAPSAQADVDHAFSVVEQVVRALNDDRAERLGHELLSCLQEGPMLGCAPDGTLWPVQEGLLSVLFTLQRPATSLVDFARTLVPALQRAAAHTPTAEHDQLLRLQWPSLPTELSAPSGSSGSTARICR
jgi:hypothetical protein